MRHARERNAEGKAFLGVKAILAVEPFDSPTGPRPRKSLDPRLAAGGDQAMMVAAKRLLREFRSAYREAFKHYCDGIAALFPHGTLLLRKRFGITCADALDAPWCPRQPHGGSCAWTWAWALSAAAAATKCRVPSISEVRPAGKLSSARISCARAATVSVLHYPVRYVWDRRKAESNARKHKIRFDEAVSVFRDPMLVFVEDLDHGDGRYIALGMSERQRVLHVVHIEIGDHETRLISARRATSHERRPYEEGE